MLVSHFHTLAKAAFWRSYTQTHPDFHQADGLKVRVDEQIMKEGMWGVGIGAAVVGVGLAVLFGSSRR